MTVRTQRTPPNTVPRVPEPFIHRERVRFGDLDAMRHLNNVVYLRYFESARIAYLSELSPDHSPSTPSAARTA